MKSFIDRRPHFNWTVALIAGAALFQGVFALTYPLNAGASDNPVYLEMMRTGTSNLILASGYPALMHALLSVLQVPNPGSVFDTNWLAAVQLTQNVIHFCFLVAFAWLASRVFSVPTARWLVVLLACSTLFLGGLNSGAPEWLQGDLIALSLLVAIKGFTDTSHKHAYHVGAFGLIAIAYLVKPNSLVVIPSLLALCLLDTGSLGARLLRVGVAGLVAGLVVNLFVALYHLPTTGARQLNYDHAWVLTASMPNDYFAALPDDLGLNALRWRALSTLVPPDYDVAHAFATIDTGAPESVRVVYQREFDIVMEMSREALIGHARVHPLPEQFQQGVSAIPLYWYIGFQQADDLGIAVFTESVKRRWSYYLRKTVDGIGAWGAYQVNVVPFESNPLGLLMASAPDANGILRYSVAPGEVPYFKRYWHPREVVWAPGVVATEQLATLFLPRFVEAGLVILSLVAMARLVDRRRQFALGAVLAALVAFAVSGYVLLGVRDKELISMMPTVAIIYGSGLAWASTRLNAMRRRESGPLTLPGHADETARS